MDDAGKPPLGAGQSGSGDEKRPAAGAQPVRAGLAGTPLVHYGAIWDARLTQEEKTENIPVAVLVCHGMGQQVRYETISSVAEAILTEARDQGGTISPVEVHLAQQNGEFLSRAEIHWTDKTNVPHDVHVYEAYWAPLTEGQVTYWETVKFLLAAAGNGLNYTLFKAGKFQRWVFGGPKDMNIWPGSAFGLICVLLFLFLQVGIVGYVSLQLAQQYKTLVSQPLPEPGAPVPLRAVLKWAAPLVPGHHDLLHKPVGERDWWAALGHLLLWIALIGEAFFARYFIVEFVGDVAAYVAPYKDSKFDEIRHKIQKVGLDVGKVIYGFGSTSTAGAPDRKPPTENEGIVPEYNRVVVVGHSLGSVLAYDTLNALINQDNVSLPPERRNVAGRTRALITFGSPLDKTAFIFRMQARCEQDWIREQLSASMQPLIVNYALYRRPPFQWINIWSPMDIISGSLDYYDDPALPPSDPRHVQNMPDPQARKPLLAHVQYWGNELLRKQIYKFVS
jgi:hypothetical protein